MLFDTLLYKLSMFLKGVLLSKRNSTPPKRRVRKLKRRSTTSDTKIRLTNPKLPHGYLFKNQQLLPLSEEGPPKLYSKQRWNPYVPPGNRRYSHSFNEKSNKIEFRMKKTMCFVSDDLTISPSLASRISILNDAGIPLSDVKEAVFHIGPNEVKILTPYLQNFK